MSKHVNYGRIRPWIRNNKADLRYLKKAFRKRRAREKRGLVQKFEKEEWFYMNWKSEAVEKLRDYEARKASIASIPGEIRALKEQYGAIRSSTSDGTPVTGGGSGREDMLLSNIVKREELARSLRQAVSWVRLVDAGLEILSQEERLILDRFYIHPAKGNVDRLCEELGLERTAVYSRKDKALRHFTICLYGAVES